MQNTESEPLVSAIDTYYWMARRNPRRDSIHIDLIEDFKEMRMRGLVAPLLYQDFSEKNSMHFANLNEAQFTLFWKCWQHNLRVINDIIPIIIRNKTYGPPMKLFMAILIKQVLGQ
jgi:hypothetical protein